MDSKRLRPHARSYWEPGNDSQALLFFRQTTALAALESGRPPLPNSTALWCLQLLCRSLNRFTLLAYRESGRDGIALPNGLVMTVLVIKTAL
jgi:hypothetical protein